MLQKVTIALGPTWKGFEFVVVKRYKRKKGYRIDYVRRYWSGKFRTLATDYASSYEEIVEKIGRRLFVRLSDEDLERIRELCGE